jgi:hypothetical protein
MVGILPLNTLWAQTPEVKIKVPAIPSFLEPLYFQTFESMVLPPEASGMVSDPFSDLAWNPAFVVRPNKRMVYLDYGLHNRTEPHAFRNFSHSFGTSGTLPNEMLRTDIHGQIQPLTNRPLVNVAAIFQISKRFSLGIVNKTVVDRQPFLDVTDKSNSPFDVNRQAGSGVHTELSLGYKIGNIVDIGFRVGYYGYRRDGEFKDNWKDDKTLDYFDNQNESIFDVSGNHTDLGVGLVIHIDPSTSLGVSAGITSGDSSEQNKFDEIRTGFRETIDISNSREQWFRYGISNWHWSECDGERKYATITYEHQLGTKWALRHFFSYSDYSMDCRGGLNAPSPYEFNRYEEGYIRYNPGEQGSQYFISEHFHLEGTAVRNAIRWKFSTSALYTPSPNWSFFGGIQVQRYSLKEEFQEHSDSAYVYQREYNYDNSSEIIEERSRRHGDYWVDATFKQLWIYLPVGIKITPLKKLELTLGADLSLSISTEEQTARKVYPQINESYRRNGILTNTRTLTDVFVNYTYQSPKTLYGHVRHHIGLTYHVAKGLDLYLRSFGKIFEETDWWFGVMVRW